MAISKIGTNSLGNVTDVSSSTTLSLKTAGTTAVTVDASQNVGIGTTNPANKLAVVSTGDRPLLAQSGTDTPAVFKSTISNAYIQIGNSSFDTYIGAVDSNQTFTVNGAERMRIDSSGNVTAPNQPVACIRTDVTYNAPASDTKMVFTSLTTNVGSYYSTSTGRFTAPVAGTYFFYTSMHTNGTGAGRHTIRRNGTQFFGAAVTSTSWSNACCSGFITMAANDYLEIWCSAGAYIHGDPNWGSWGIRLVS